MATTFEFREGRPVGRTTAATLGEASAALPVGSYTTLRTYGGSGVVRLALHARRLVESLPPDRGAPLETADLRAALAHALRETRHPESRLRVTFAPPRLFVSVEPFAPPDPALLRTGVACMTIRMQRDRPEAKDSRFLATAQSAYAALPAMVHEGLMVDPEGAILEGLSSNFFAIRGGRLHTEDARALAGVTRSMVLELAADVAPRGEGPVHVHELAEVAECFITSVSREVLPVVRIDGTTIGDGKPGPLTGEIVRRFAAAVARETERLA
jgi:branched-subunit amino acid aminotransferase/4-amino-4-deoxychorismate lyase